MTKQFNDKIQDTRKLYYLKREINTWIMLSLALKNYESLHNTETKNVCTQNKLYKNKCAAHRPKQCY